MEIFYKLVMVKQISHTLNVVNRQAKIHNDVTGEQANQMAFLSVRLESKMTRKLLKCTQDCWPQSLNFEHLEFVAHCLPLF